MALAEQRVNWTGALFRINWSNLQQLVPTTLFSYIVNAGSARSDDFETEIDAPLYRGDSGSRRARAWPTGGVHHCGEAENPQPHLYGATHPMTGTELMEFFGLPATTRSL